MQILSLIWGILSLLGAFVAFMPCLGSLNWINIPFSGIGLIISIVAAVTGDTSEPKGKAIAGIILCGLAILIGAIRLIVGFGVV